MSVSEQIISLSISIEEGDEEYFHQLEESLSFYHELVDAGYLIPRGNKVQDSYMLFSYSSNFG